MNKAASATLQQTSMASCTDGATRVVIPSHPQQKDAWSPGTTWTCTECPRVHCVPAFSFTLGMWKVVRSPECCFCISLGWSLPQTFHKANLFCLQPLKKKKKSPFLTKNISAGWLSIAALSDVTPTLSGSPLQCTVSMLSPTEAEAGSSRTRWTCRAC